MPSIEPPRQAHPKKIYVGRSISKDEGREVIVRREYPLPWRRDLIEHSWGLNWGYGGSGPTQAALAILSDFLDDDERAHKLTRQFLDEVVSKMGCEWEITEDELWDWLDFGKIPPLALYRSRPNKSLWSIILDSWRQEKLDKEKKLAKSCKNDKTKL
jgi:hypothetical protein